MFKCICKDFWTYFPISTATPTVLLEVDIGATKLHCLAWGSHRSTVFRYDHPSCPPTAYIGPSSTPTPSPCLWVDMGGMRFQDFFFGSKHSTVFSVLSPSLPPTMYSLSSMTATPNWRRRPLMFATWVHEFVRRSYFSIVVAPEMDWVC